MAYYNFYVYEIYSILLKERYLDVKTIDYDPYLERSHLIVNYIYQHHEKNIKLSDLSKLTKLSVDRLSHVIKDALGISFQKFVQQVRFEHALHLLQESDLDVLSISKKAGFSDHKYFVKIMKERFNKTILAYRKSYHEMRDENQGFHLHNHFITEIKKCLHHLEEDTRFTKLFVMEPIKF